MNRVALREEKITDSARLLHLSSSGLSVMTSCDIGIYEAIMAATRHAMCPLEVELEVRANFQHFFRICFLDATFAKDFTAI